MYLTILIGVLIGVLGFLPLFGGLLLTKRVTKVSNLGYAGALLLGLLISFVILAGALIACIMVARDQILPFTLAVVGGLCGSAVIYGVYKLVRK